MAKICKKCGVKYNNNATYCVMCGAEFYDERGLKERKFKHISKIVFGILAAAALVFIIFNTGPKAAVRRIMSNYKRNNADAIVATYPSFLMESDKFDKETLIWDTKNNVQSVSGYLFSYRIDSMDDPSSREYDELMANFRYFGGNDFDESDIEGIKIIWVYYTGNVPAVWPMHATRFIVIKYQGHWCWWPETISR